MMINYNMMYIWCIYDVYMMYIYSWSDISDLYGLINIFRTGHHKEVSWKKNLRQLGMSVVKAAGIETSWGINFSRTQMMVIETVIGSGSMASFCKHMWFWQILTSAPTHGSHGPFSLPECIQHHQHLSVHLGWLPQDPPPKPLKNTSEYSMSTVANNISKALL